MLGRGIDQILPTPSDPRLFEPVVRSALEYVKLAEDQHGPIPRPATFEYVWGDALSELESIKPAARIINPETAITTSGDPWSDKEIHYRMHPANIPCLKVAGIDCCVLALMYFPTLEADSGDLLGLGMVPMQTRRLRINRASADDTRWLTQRKGATYCLAAPTCVVKEAFGSRQELRSPLHRSLQCSFTWGSVRRVMRRASVSSATLV